MLIGHRAILLSGNEELAIANFHAKWPTYFIIPNDVTSDESGYRWTDSIQEHHSNSDSTEEHRSNYYHSPDGAA